MHPLLRCLGHAALLLLPSLALAKDLARVNAVSINTQSFRQALLALGVHGEVIAEQRDLREQFLQQLIATELKAQAAQQRQLQHSEAYRLRLAQAEKQILAALLRENSLAEQTTPQALRAYFEGQRERFTRAQVKASQILLRNFDEAQRVLQQVKKQPARSAKERAEHFAALAKRYSVGEEALRHGDLGWLAKGSQSLTFEKAAFSCPQGRWHEEVITRPAGFHLLFVNEVAYYHDRSFAALEKEIRLTRLRELEDELNSGLAKKAQVYVDKKALEEFRLGF